VKVGGQQQITLNTVKVSCLQCLESGLAVKHSNLADWTMNWPRTCWINYGPRPFRPGSTRCWPPCIYLTLFTWWMLRDLIVWFCELWSTQTEEQKTAPEQGYSDTMYSRTISYQWMLHNIQCSLCPHVSHTHPT